MGLGSAMGTFITALESYEAATKKKKADELTPRGMYTGNTTDEVFSGESETMIKTKEYDTPKLAKAMADGFDIDKDLVVQKYDIPELYHGDQVPDKIVTHRTAGYGFHTPNDKRALSKGLGAHFTIDRDGKVHQIGNPETKLWHAGPKGNNGGIGIEVTGKYVDGKWENLTPHQERALQKLGKGLMKKYKIGNESVMPHYKLAPKSGDEGQKVADLLIANYMRYE